MKLKNILIVVSDIQKSKKFYKDLFGLEVILDNDGNVILTEGLVLQDRTIWEKFLEKEIIVENNASELYFEESDIEAFVEKLDNYSEPIKYVNRLMEHSWGQRVVRIYDPDKHIIEIGENIKVVCQRFLDSGMTPEQVAERMDVPMKFVNACMR